MLELNQTVETLINTGQELAETKSELERVQERENIETVEGVTYIRKDGVLSPPQSYPKVIRTFAGLDAILAYRRYINDHFDSPDMLYWVEDGRVNLFSARRYGVHVQEPIFAVAKAPDQTATLDTFMSIEKFMLMLKTSFVLDYELRNLISVIGNVRYEDGLTIADDGISQEAHAKAGVHLVEKSKLPADLTLTRFESFPEIQENIPRRPYFLRLKAENGGNPVAALFGVADPAADLQIRHLIKAYLVQKLTEDDGLDPTAADNMVLV